MFLKQESVWISNDLDDFRKRYDFENKMFPDTVNRQFGNQMILGPETSLGVMVS